MKDYEEVKDTKDITEETEHKDDYEDVCYLCRRPESKAGKLIRLPMEGICICPDCMQRSFRIMRKKLCPLPCIIIINGWQPIQWMRLKSRNPTCL